jgi:hypothetical protein
MHVKTSVPELTDPTDPHPSIQMGSGDSHYWCQHVTTDSPHGSAVKCYRRRAGPRGATARRNVDITCRSNCQCQPQKHIFKRPPLFNSDLESI